MALFQAAQLKYPGPRQPLTTADGSNDLVPIFGDFTVPTGMASGDIIEMVGLPPGYVPVDLIIHSEALGATATSDVGIMSGNTGDLLDLVGAARTCGNEALAAAALGAAGVFRPLKKDFGMIAPTLGDPTTNPRTTGERSIGIKITTFTTPTVGAKVRATLLCRPMQEGV